MTDEHRRLEAARNTVEATAAKTAVTAESER